MNEISVRILIVIFVEWSRVEESKQRKKNSFSFILGVEHRARENPNKSNKMDVQFFKQNSKNQNTLKATNSWYRTYCNWATKNGVPTEINTMDKRELNTVLETFFAQVVRNDGKHYEPTSLCSLQAGLERYLKEIGCTFSILNDIEFKGSRDVLEGKAKYLRQDLGMGKKPNKSHSLDVEEERLLWESGQLGIRSARSLTNTVWYLLTQHFGLRGRQEHHKMNVEDFSFRSDDNGNRYVTFAEGVTKTRGGGLRKKERLVIPKMFETQDDRCPVTIFEYFLAKRPECFRTSGPVYLAIIDNPKDDIWFKITRLGVNSIDNIMRNMVKKAALPTEKKLTNHSARKTVVKKLRKSGASRSDIIEITGHSNERGLDPYDSGDEAQQRQMSLAIDRPSCSKISKRDALIPNKKSFELLTNEMYEKISGESRQEASINYNFYNCEVSFAGAGPEQQRKKQLSVSKKRVKKRVIYSSDDCSQE